MTCGNRACGDVYLVIEYSRGMEKYAEREKKLAEEYGLYPVMRVVPGRHRFVVWSDWGAKSDVSGILNHVVEKC